MARRGLPRPPPCSQRSRFILVARFVSLDVSLRCFSRQLSWAGFLNGLVEILFSQRPRASAPAASQVKAGYAETN
eukprot:7084066-Pyramimonas_sp.AAC.1